MSGSVAEAGVATLSPTVTLLLILIRESRFKRATMQVERDHIGSGESALGESSQEQFVDDAFAGAADPTLLFGGRMGGDDDPARLAAYTQGNGRTVIEGATDAALRMGYLLIGGKCRRVYTSSRSSK